MDDWKRLEAIMRQRFETESSEDGNGEEHIIDDNRQQVSDCSDSFQQVSESDMESEHEEDTPFIEKRQPDIVVHDDSLSSKSLESINKSDFRKFMSSKVKFKKSGSEQLVKRFKSDSEIQQDKTNSKNDQDLENLIKTSRIVEKFNVESLQGKERHSYMKKQIVGLGGKAELSFSARAPKPMRLGMEKKQVERAKKRLQEAKDMGMYHSKTKHLYEDPCLRKKAEVDVRRKWDRRGDINKSRVGRFKNGVLSISKRDIEKTTAVGSKRKLGTVGSKAMGSVGSAKGPKKKGKKRS